MRTPSNAARSHSRWRTALVRAGLAALTLSFASACSSADPTSALAGSREAPGAAVPVESSVTPGVPEGHPTVPVADPASNNDHVGRAARRMNVRQLREALRAATGANWVARRTVSDPDSPTGTRVDPEADMFDVLAATLGRADYVTSTRNSIDPGVTFSKLAGDAARATCASAVTRDATVERASRNIMREVDPTTTVASDRAAVRRNLSVLVLRFWGRTVDPADPQLDSLERLFERASTLPAVREGTTMRVATTPSDGWRAVCVALATDPQFLTY